MNFKKAFGALMVMLALTAVACGGEQKPADESKAPVPSSNEVKPASSDVKPASSDVTPAHNHDLEAVAHDKGEGEVVMDIKKCKEDAYYELKWNAEDEAATKSGFTNGKFGANGDYIEFKIWSPVQMNARLFANAKYNKSNIKGVATSEHHTVWYDWRADKDAFKVKVTVNSTEIDQSAQSVNIGGKDIALKDLNFPDLNYGDSSDEVLEMPWVSVALNQGANTIRLERTSGYGHTYQNFVLKTIL